MSYIDDWGSTPEDVHKDLIRTCANGSCGHVKYRHGNARETRVGGRQGPVKYESGTCELCRCRLFREDPAITGDEILDIHDALKDDIRVEDMFTTAQWEEALRGFTPKE